MRSRFNLGHPLLIAVFPAISFYSHNLSEFRFADALPTMIGCVLVALVIVAACTAALRSFDRAVVIASIILLAWTAYGIIYQNRMLGLIVGGRPLIRHLVLLPLAVVAVATVVIYVLRRMKDASQLHAFFTVFGVIACSLAILPIFTQRASATPKHRAAAVSPARRSSQSPNIYFIILDGYARADVLRDVFGSDERTIAKPLTELGFQVVENSWSNYPLTWFSLASMLNMRYVNPKLHPRAQYLRELIQNNAVVDSLINYGYQIVNISSGISATAHWDRADENLCRTGPDMFAVSWLQTTPAYRVAIMYTRTIRRQVKCQFSALEKVAGGKGKKFVFAHILSPHPPFVFDEEGADPGGPVKTMTAADAWEKRDLYMNQLRYVSKRTVAAVRRILKEEQGGAIVIVQSDHGPASLNQWKHPTALFLRERLGNLYAVYSGNLNISLPSCATPVNTFRRVFNAVGITNSPLLPDSSFFMSWENHRNYISLHNPECLSGT